MKRTELTKPSVMKPQPTSDNKLLINKQLLNQFQTPSEKTPESQNKPKSIQNRPTKITMKPLNKLKPELPKEKENTPSGLKLTTN